MSIGDKIKLLRKENKLTLKDLSMKTGLSISFISDIENKRRNPSIDTAKILANAFGISVSELLDDENNLNSGSFQEKEISIDKKIELLDEEMELLFSKVKKLSKEDRQRVLKMLDIFTEENDN